MFEKCEATVARSFVLVDLGKPGDGIGEIGLQLGDELWLHVATLLKDGDLGFEVAHDFPIYKSSVEQALQPFELTGEDGQFGGI